MHKIFYPLFLVVFSSSLFASETSMNIDMKNILAPKAEELNLESLFLGKPIHAYQVDKRTQFAPPRFEHVAYYIDGIVTTLISGGNNWECVGTQKLYLKNDFVSESSDWKTVVIDGINYIMYDHGSFFVFSNEIDQFVISK